MNKQVYLICILFFVYVSGGSCTTTLIRLTKLDSFNITGIGRDFWPCKRLDSCGTLGVNTRCDSSKCHPDFERNITSNQVYDLDIPQRLLKLPERVPLYNSSVSHPTITNATYFNLFYNTVPGTLHFYILDTYTNLGFNMEKNVMLTLDNCASSGCNSLEYKTNNPSWFPLDDFGFGNYPDYKQNNHFTWEFHARFVASQDRSEYLKFIGNDDVWVFIDGKYYSTIVLLFTLYVRLVYDIGGIHNNAPSGPALYLSQCCNWVAPVRKQL